MMLLDAATLPVLTPTNENNNQMQQKSPKQTKPTQTTSVCQNFLTPLWFLRKVLTWTANCKADTVYRGSYGCLNMVGFVSAQAIYGGYSSNGVFQSASETFMLICSAVVLSSSGGFVPAIATTQCCHLMCSILSGL